MGAKPTNPAVIQPLSDFTHQSGLSDVNPVGLMPRTSITGIPRGVKFQQSHDPRGDLDYLIPPAPRGELVNARAIAAFHDRKKVANMTGIRHVL